MPKPMLRTPQQAQNQMQTNSILSTTNISQRQNQNQQQQQIDQMRLDRLLRRPRSKAYMEAIHKLDAGGHVHNQAKVNEIIDTIKNELPEVDLSGVLQGFVAICYLGRPYEVHTLDMIGGIIEHFEAGRPLPDGLEKARGIALRGGYDFIEVYVDCCRAISANGAVSVISY